jgi:nucleotide-binding universal stress UspA family protein
VQRILAAIDFSPHAARALEHAVALARLFGARIELLSAVGLPPLHGAPAELDRLVEDLRARALAGLEQLAAPLRTSGLAVDCAVTTDPPASGIVIRADQTHADLIALGTRGLSGVAHVLLGSTAERTLRLARCPVLVAHADSPPARTPKTLLVPTDFSPHADAALRFASRLAEKTGAGLVLVHAYYLPPGMDASAAVIDDVVRRSVEQEAKQRLESLRGAIGGAAARLVVTHGRPETAVVEATREHAADLVVMGTRGRTGLASFFIGSVAERVIRRSQVPVIAVKAAP